MSEPVAPQGTEPPPLSDHDKAMLKKVDDAHAALQPPAPPAPTAPARPEHVPEKFWDAEKGTVRTDELLKSYVELEKARATPAPAAPPAAPQLDAEGKPIAPPAGKPDFLKLADEFRATGQLSEDHMKTLEGAGISREVAEQFIAGQQALASARDAEGYAVSGGKEQHEAMIAWASQNWTPDQQAAFDKAVHPSSPKASMLLAIRGLKAAYEQSNGSQPNLTQGTPGGTPTGAFASRAEVTAAMRDPRYRADPAYRADVERRVNLMPTF